MCRESEHPPLRIIAAGAAGATRKSAENAAQPGRAARIERLTGSGYPAYTTSPGWLGYSDEKLTRLATEAVAQVGAILILAKPENKGQLIFFRGMERVRFRAPVHAGDVVVIEANVKRLRSRMGVLEGQATVNGRVVVNGTMTFALGSE